MTKLTDDEIDALTGIPLQRAVGEALGWTKIVAYTDIHGSESLEGTVPEEEQEGYDERLDLPRWHDEWGTSGPLLDALAERQPSLAMSGKTWIAACDAPEPGWRLVVDDRSPHVAICRMWLKADARGLFGAGSEAGI